MPNVTQLLSGKAGPGTRHSGVGALGPPSASRPQGMTTSLRVRRFGVHVEALLVTMGLCGFSLTHPLSVD